jgi:hypothetical protein
MLSFLNFQRKTSISMSASRMNLSHDSPVVYPVLRDIIRLSPKRRPGIIYSFQHLAGQRPAGIPRITTSA